LSKLRQLRETKTEIRLSNLEEKVFGKHAARFPASMLPNAENAYG
jgi:hypothetical protein